MAHATGSVAPRHRPIHIAKVGCRVRRRDRKFAAPTRAYESGAATTERPRITDPIRGADEYPNFDAKFNT